MPVSDCGSFHYVSIRTLGDLDLRSVPLVVSLHCSTILPFSSR